MNKKASSGLMLNLMLIGMLTLAFNIQLVKASGTIHIRPDGSIDPPDAPIYTADKITYYFIDNIYDSIVVERDNIVVDGAGYTLQGTGAYESKGIYLLARSNVTIKNVEIKAFYFGIHLYASSNNNISGNTIADHLHGIALDHSSKNSVSGNSITASIDFGIHLRTSSNNSVAGNTITNNWGGIRVASSSNNSVAGNIITDNNYGILLAKVSDSSISGNTIAANKEDGIFLFISSNNSITGNTITKSDNGMKLDESSNNKFYHNNFMNNTQQVYVKTSGYTNFWDNGYPSGGNYWSNHVGVDLYRGPYQNLSGRDGIIDTPYVIDEENQDNYPLMKPYVPGILTVSIYTDKYTYHAGDAMQLGLNVRNPDSVKHLCFAIWVELPDSAFPIYVYMHEHSVVLPIGLNYVNPAFETIVLPSLPPGVYTWHAAFLKRATHTIMTEDTAEWEFIPTSTT